METDEMYKGFLNKAVDVGIPHIFEQGKLFFIKGIVIDVRDDFLVLKITDGIRKIPFADVIEIKVTEGY